MALERTMVVATLFKLYRVDGRFTKSDMKAVKKDKVVPMATIEKYNSQWKSCGKFYEVNEKKTEEYFTKSDERNVKLAEAEKAKNQLANTLANLAKGKIDEDLPETTPTNHKKEQEDADKKAKSEKKKEISKVYGKHQKALEGQDAAEKELDAVDTELAEEGKSGDKKLLATQEKLIGAFNDAKAEAINAEGALDYVKGTVTDDAWLSELLASLAK